MQATYHLEDEAPAAPLPALSAACALVGDRWSLPIVAALLPGALRYSELRECLPAVAPNILSARLRRLEEDGLIVSVRYCERPPRFEYRLTPTGAALEDVIRLLGAWAARDASADAQVHERCGGRLELRWWCPTCQALVSPQDAETMLV